MVSQGYEHSIQTFFVLTANIHINLQLYKIDIIIHSNNHLLVLNNREPRIKQNTNLSLKYN